MGGGADIVCDQWLANGTIINLLSVAPERSEETKVFFFFWGGGAGIVFDQWLPPPPPPPALFAHSVPAPLSAIHTCGQSAVTPSLVTTSPLSPMAHNAMGPS